MHKENPLDETLNSWRAIYDEIVAEQDEPDFLKNYMGHDYRSVHCPDIYQLLGQRKVTLDALAKSSQMLKMQSDVNGLSRQDISSIAS
jgi:hypothetical protein